MSTTIDIESIVLNAQSAVVQDYTQRAEQLEEESDDVTDNDLRWAMLLLAQHYRSKARVLREVREETELVK